MTRMPVVMVLVCLAPFVSTHRCAATEPDSSVCQAPRTQVGGLICNHTIWTKENSPYLVTQSVILGCSATLVIEPGVVVCFPRSLRGLGVGSGAFGTAMLIARGTANEPILFTSAEADPAPGDWAGINFADAASDAFFDSDGNYLNGSILEHVIVEYAGAGHPPGAVTVALSSPLIVRNRIRLNAGTGLSVSSGTGIPPMRIEENEIADNLAGGILMSSGGPHRVRANLIARNAERAFTYLGGLGSGRLVMLEDNTMHSNGGGVSMVESRGSVVRGNRIENNDVGFANGGGMELIACSDLTISENVLVGNSARHGGAGFLHFASSTTISDNVIIANRVAGQGAGLAMVDGNDVTITGCTIANNMSHRFDPTDAGCPAGAGGVYIVGTTRVRLSAGGQPPNAVFGNTGYAVFNDSPFGGSGLSDVNATSVWWGTTAMAEIDVEICDAFDDLTRAIVYFAPWNQTGRLDLDGNGRIERADWNGLAACLSQSGPTTPASVECSVGDVDLNGKVDLHDVAVYLAALRTP